MVKLFHIFPEKLCSSVHILLLYSLECTRLENIEITDKNINLIIKNLKVDKVHRWDNMSIRMIKLRIISTALPLRLIFQSILNKLVFPSDWKKSNIGPCQKKQIFNKKLLTDPA